MKSMGAPGREELLLAEIATLQARLDELQAGGDIRFRQLAENMQEVFWIFDPVAWRVEYVSPAYEQVWGRSCASLYAEPRSFLEAVHPEDRPAVVRALEHQILGEQTVEQYRVVRQDGSIRWIHDRGFPVRDESGQVIHVSGIAEDITEARRLAGDNRRLYRAAQEELAERSAIAAQLAEQTETLATINRIGRMLSAELDLGKLVQAVTDAATEITGAQFGAFFYNVANQSGESYTLFTISGVPRERFSHHPMPRNTHLFGPTFYGEGVIRVGDVRVDPRYGKNPPYFGLPPRHLPVVSYLAVPVISRSGEVLGGLFFGHEEAGVFAERHEQIVEGLAAQTAIAMDNARLVDQLQHAVRARDEFLSVAAHELKTPITSLRGFSQLLLRRFQSGQRSDGEQVAHWLRRIDFQAVKLTRLIEQLLDVSRIEAHKLALDYRETDLAALLASVGEDMQATTAKHNLRILSPPALPAVVDPLRVEQVLVNLVDNAIKYAPDGGPVELELRESRAGEVALSVADRGFGIPVEQRGLLFNRFYQAHPETQRGGMGLGLYISRQIAELHGGTLDAEFPDEGGTRFVLTLPRFPAGYAESLDHGAAIRSPAPKALM